MCRSATRPWIETQAPTAMDDLIQAHRRYSEQANWTAELRQHLYELAALKRAARVLEVGCGTGVVTSELARLTMGKAYGLDVDLQALTFAKGFGPTASYVAADGAAIPHPESTFDLVVCHFLLLWIPDPEPVLSEMVRVTAPAGAVLALAEPDYGGRIDHPPALAQVGLWQTAALHAQGADPFVGRKLRALFKDAGLVQVRAGLLGGEWHGAPGEGAFDSEWDTLQFDLRGRISPEEIEGYRKMAKQAWEAGSRILYVPTFYAFGLVPSHSP